jgi:hypothetical protein
MIFPFGSVNFCHAFQGASQLGKGPGSLDGAGPGGGEGEFLHPKFPEDPDDFFRLPVGSGKVQPAVALLFHLAVKPHHVSEGFPFCPHFLEKILVESWQASMALVFPAFSAASNFLSSSSCRS